MEAAYRSPNSDSETQWHTGVTLASVLPKNLPERGAGPLGGGGRAELEALVGVPLLVFSRVSQMSLLHTQA